MSELKTAYTIAIANQLPKGIAWKAKRIVDSNLYKLLFSIAEIFNDIDCRLTDLLREMHASTAIEMNPEWEKEIYDPKLFDCIDELPLDLQLKIQAVIAKAFAIGGNRIEYFTQIALLLGLDVIITERYLDDFTVRIDVGPPFEECEDGQSLGGECDDNTKPIAGTAEKVVLTTTAESLTELGVVIDSEMKSLRITFGGLISDPKIVARFWEEGTDPTATEGHPVISLDPIVFTREQALGLNLRSTMGNLDMQITQYDYEFQSLHANTICASNVCARLFSADNDLEISAYGCLLAALIPAQLTFLIFVDNKPYDIITANQL